ncbi:MAG: hypothetical protein QOD83_1969 [Solirubrobacteraceae bacterium]|jgi:hypothetical protein|nr:hypothetical protein [Solirubrobacteraceae bacterium]
MELFDFEIDLGTQSLTILGSRPQIVPLPPGLFSSMPGSNIQRITVRLEARHAVLQLPLGVEATVELGIGRTAPEMLAGRKVVYLDQNHWSTLSRWQNGNVRVSTSDAEAAERLVELVKTGEVVLPASGGHLVETTPQYDDRRVALASTVLSLSRGWQMRNPLHVRTEELRRALEGRHPPAANDVFALNAEEILSTRMPRADCSELPQPFAGLSAELVSILALYDIVVDRTAICDDGGKAQAEAWAADWQRVARLLHDDGFSPDYIGRVAHARLVIDVGLELIAVGRRLGLGPEEVWMPLFHESDPVGSMPYLSRARGVLSRRMRNSTQKWQANHFIDIHFLACAAGYADMVIGEIQTIDYLQQVRDVSGGAALAKTLPAGVALLDGR